MSGVRCGSAAWLIGLLLALAMPMAAAAADISVSAAVQSTDVAVGEPFALTIQVDGAQNVPVPSVEVDGFRSDYLGPSTQVSLVNGRVSHSVTHRYRLIAEREGQFTLGPFAVAHDDRRYETAPLSVRVRAAGTRPSAASAPGGSDALKLVVQLGKTEAYVGERVPLTVTLYVGNLNVHNLQFPIIAADGLTVEKFDQPQQASEVVDGRRYTTVRLRTMMTLVHPGAVEVRGSQELDVASSRRGVDPFFDQLFGRGDSRTVQVQSEPVPITVLPLPEAGRPTGFGGAVGRFTFDLEAKPTALDAGDPITLRMTIAGNGNLSGLTPPVVPAGGDFRRYDAQPVKGEDSPVRRVFEQVLIPQRDDIRAIPAVSFSFFDPDTRAYQIIARGPIPIEVRPSSARQGAVVDAGPAAAPTVQAQAALGRDIVFIKDAPGTFVPRAAAGDGWLALLWLAPLLACAGLWAVQRRREWLAADPRLVRFRAAGREARLALAAVGAGDAPALDRVSAAMAAYLGAKLDLPPGGVERARILARLDAAGVEADLRARVVRFLDLSERARYAPSGDAQGERRAAIDLAIGIVDGLERQRGLERRLGSAAVLALALAVALAALAPARAEAPPPQAAFFQANQAYADGRYGEAVQAYETVRAAGLTSGALEFNLGNAWMKQGDLGRAIAAYRRAARQLPRDPDVAANLAFAQEQARVEPAPPPIWQRLAFPFAAAFTSAGLATAAVALWWLLWLLLAARLVVRAPGARLALGRAAAAAGVVWLRVAASWAGRMLELEPRDAAVVVAPGETAARFEPSAAGTEHFALTPGAALAVLEERDDWLQVRRDDGLRGWIPAAAVDRVDR